MRCVIMNVVNMHMAASRHVHVDSVKDVKGEGKTGAYLQAK